MVNKVLDHTLVTLHGIKPTPAAVDGVVLGPTSTTTILVKGTPAEALLGMGSPVTIVSLDFLVKALTCEKEHLDNQTIREEVKRHLEPTALKLRSYSGEALPIVKKVHVCLSRGCYTVDACVQVQMNAPVQVLQGTDIQPRLGLHLVDREDPEQTRDGILKLEQQDPVQSPQTTQELPAEKEGQPIPSAMVHLIQVVKVPARHAKLVRAKTSGLSFLEGYTIAFQPGDRLHQLTGLVVEDALIPAEVSLVISNPGVSPIQLREGLLLSAAQPAAWLRDFTEPVSTTCEKDVRVHPEMPTEAALRPPVDREPFALDDYKSLAIDRMNEA